MAAGETEADAEIGLGVGDGEAVGEDGGESMVIGEVVT